MTVRTSYRMLRHSQSPSLSGFNGSRRVTLTLRGVEWPDMLSELAMVGDHFLGGISKILKASNVV